MWGRAYLIIVTDVIDIDTIGHLGPIRRAEGKESGTAKDVVLVGDTL
jgi:hypothetical protein